METNKIKLLKQRIAFLKRQLKVAHDKIIEQERNIKQLMLKFNRIHVKQRSSK